MKVIFRKLVPIIVIASILLTACGGPPQVDDINWSDPENVQGFSDVENNTDAPEPFILPPPVPGTMPSPPVVGDIEFIEWCETSTGYIDDVNCAGDEENGWWQFKDENGNITEIQVRSEGETYEIRIIDGVSYFYCINGSKAEISDDVIKNIKEKTTALEKAQDEYAKEWSDLKANLGTTLTLAVAGCIVGAAFGGITCLAGALVGIGGSLLGPLPDAIEGGFKLAAANGRVNDAKKDLEALVSSFCG